MVCNLQIECRVDWIYSRTSEIQDQNAFLRVAGTFTGKFVRTKLFRIFRGRAYSGLYAFELFCGGAAFQVHLLYDPSQRSSVRAHAAIIVPKEDIIRLKQT